MSIIEARAYLKAHAKLAVETHRVWTDLGLVLSTTELAQAVALNIKYSEDCPSPMLESDNTPF